MSLVALVGMAAPAEAATVCFTHWKFAQADEDATYIYHPENGSWRTWGEGGIYRNSSYGVTDGWSYTWQKENWKGPIFRCPIGTTCAYAWQQAHSVSSGWVINAQLGGTVGAPAPDTASANLAFIPSYNRTVTNTTSFTFTVNLGGGQYAQPFMAAQYQHQWGRTVGAWVQYGTAAEKCRTAPNGVDVRGYKDTWEPDWTVSWWNADVYQYPVSSYYTWY